MFIFRCSRFEMSSPESSLLPRDADFGYEVIEEEKNVGTIPAMSTEEDADEESSVSVASHYRGTPPLKGKKRRTSHQQRKESETRLVVSMLAYIMIMLMIHGYAALCHFNFRTFYRKTPAVKCLCGEISCGKMTKSLDVPITPICMPLLYSALKHRDGVLHRHISFPFKNTKVQKYIHLC